MALVHAAKRSLVEELLEAKKASKKSFTTIGEEVGYTNLYVAQIFHRQAPLMESGVEALKKAVPQLTPELIEKMKEIPQRTFDPSVPQDPTTYRLYEAVMHYAESIKAFINEEYGDGIMSAIGFYAKADKGVGVHGEPRVVLTFSGKFLEYTEQIGSHLDPAPQTKTLKETN